MIKGVILAGGKGSRLYPLTQVMSKQLLPVFDKPMIYYPLSLLMLMGLREIMLITTPGDQPRFIELLGDGSRFGISLTYQVQAQPRGIAQALCIAESFLDRDPCALILGDNLFYGAHLGSTLSCAMASHVGLTLFSTRVKHPQRYGVVVENAQGELCAVVEKPQNPPTQEAVTGLYLFDGEASALAHTLSPSSRGELEITDLNNLYIQANRARRCFLGRGTAWMDMGTQKDLLHASLMIESLQERQGLLVGSPEEVAVHQGWIDHEQMRRYLEQMPMSLYTKNLQRSFAWIEGGV